MSGLARKMKREKQKAEYRKFSEQWRMEKMYQKYIIEGGAQVSGNFIVHGDQTTEILGRKPTFHMYNEHVKRMKEEQPKNTDNPNGKVEVTDTEW